MILNMANIQTKELRVKEGRTELTVEHNNKDLTFLHPSYGPDTYFKVRDSIQNAELSLPTMADTASLVHTAFNSNDKYSNEIKQIVKDRWLWAFTGSLYVPRKGAYIQDNPEIRNSMPYMDESELAKKLEANDPSIRFVPFGYKTGEMSSLELAKNAYVRALAGYEGAEKLAEVADKFKNKPHLYSIDSVDNPFTRVSALSSGRYFDSHRLDVDGDLHGGNWDGHAFGVSKGGIGTVGSN